MKKQDFGTIICTNYCNKSRIGNFNKFKTSNHYNGYVIYGKFENLGYSDDNWVILQEYNDSKRGEEIYSMLCRAIAEHKEKFYLPFNWECDELGIVDNGVVLYNGESIHGDAYEYLTEKWFKKEGLKL